MSNRDNLDHWENGALGASLEHTRPVSDEESRQIDEALGLEETTLRLDIALVERFKTLAVSLGIGYKPLMRQALAQFVERQSQD